MGVSGSGPGRLNLFIFYIPKLGKAIGKAMSRTGYIFIVALTGALIDVFPVVVEIVKVQSLAPHIQLTCTLQPTGGLE